MAAPRPLRWPLLVLFLVLLVLAGSMEGEPATDGWSPESGLLIDYALAEAGPAPEPSVCIADPLCRSHGT